MSSLRALPAALVVAFGLAACGGGSSSPDAAASSSGVLVDDLVIDATVFCDANSNGVFDSGEVSTTTGANGAYTFTPACTAQVASVPGTGYDRMTLKAPKGMFRGAAGSDYVSPFTTMQIASGLSTTEFAQVLRRLGLDATVTNASRFNPVTHASGRTGAAVIKILNEIAEIVTAAGGDGAAAWKAAALAMVAWVNDPANLTGTSSPFDDLSDVKLAGFIQAAATAGFAVVPAGTWSDTAKANAADLAAEGLKRLSRRIHNHARYDEIGDDFSDGSVGGIISDIDDLEDETQVGEGRGRCRDHDFNQAQHLSLAGDAFTLYAPAPGLTGGQATYTLTQLATGLELPGLSLGSLTRLELPLQATALGLPRRGQKIALALEVKEVGGNRMLQVLIDKIELTQASRAAANNPVGATLGSRAEMYFYSRSANGIEVGTGDSAAGNLDGSVLISTDTGIALNLTALTASLRSRFPAQTGLINGVLGATGQFEFKLVVSESDLRHANGDRFTVGRVAIKTPASSRIAERLNGTVVSGRLHF